MGVLHCASSTAHNIVTSKNLLPCCGDSVFLPMKSKHSFQYPGYVNFIFSSSSSVPNLCLGYTCLISVTENEHKNEIAPLRNDHGNPPFYCCYQLVMGTHKRGQKVPFILSWYTIRFLDSLIYFTTANAQ